MFTPKIAFNYEGRQIHGGTWLELSQTRVSGFDQVAQEPGTGYSQLDLTDLSITWLDLINISSNVSVSNTLVVKKIELVDGA